MRILLIQAQWPARALLKAEMEGRGHEVLGADSVAMAVELSLQRGFRPEAIVLDTLGLPLRLEDVERLRFLRGAAPLVLVETSQQAGLDTVALAPTLRLRRPVSVGEIVDTVTVSSSALRE